MLSRARLLEVLDYDAATGVFRWKAGTHFQGRIAGHIHAKGYRRIGIDYEQYQAHLLAWFYVHGHWPPDEIDHRNLNRDDNRIANLRPATTNQNQHNRSRSRNNTTGFKGVSFHQRAGRWRANIKVDGKPIYLGLYDTPEEAHAAYSAAAIRHFGAFARTE